MSHLDRLLVNRIEAHGRIAQAAPRTPEWEAAMASLGEIEARLRGLRTRPRAMAQTQLGAA